MAQEHPEAEFRAVGRADFGPGEFRDFDLDGASVLVANCDGDYYAIEDRCSHDNGPLAEGRLYWCEIECPRHGGKFDVKTGKATALPAFNAVRRYAVRVVNGQIEVRPEAPPAKPGQDPRDFGGLSVFST